MLIMLESGLDSYWYSRYWPKVSSTDICKDVQKRKGKQKLKLRDLQSAFLILAIGLVLAIAAFLLEMICFMVGTRHKNSVSQNTNVL